MRSGKPLSGRQKLLGLGLFATLLLAVALGHSQWLGGALTHRFTSDSMLSHGQPVGACVSSVDCLTNIGGVAFGGIAIPTDANTRISGLRYDSTRSDGSRLVVTLEGGAELVADIADWTLVPTARFADGTQDACFTLFGKLSDPNEQKFATANGYEILSYHPAFHDTLLGLRVFHSDVLILSAASAKLPTVNGNYLLGFGESAPDVVANEQALASLVPYVEDSGGNQIFRSYLITDHQQQVHFKAQGGKLQLDGWPLWYLWRFSVTDEELDVLSQQASAQAQDALNAEFDDDRLTLTEEELEAKYTDAYVDQRTRTLWDELLSPRVLQPLLTESAQLSNHIRAIGGVNPAVYQALTNVMRYGAFFRYVKAVAPTTYSSFVSSLPCTLKPSLYTPNGYVVGSAMTMDSDAVPGPSTCSGGGTSTTAGGTSTTAGGASTAAGGTSTTAGGTSTAATAQGGASAVVTTAASGGTDLGIGSSLAQGSTSTPVSDGGSHAASGTGSVAQGGSNPIFGGTKGTESSTVVAVVSNGGALASGGHSGTAHVDPIGRGGLLGGTRNDTGVPNTSAATDVNTDGCGCRVARASSSDLQTVMLLVGASLTLLRRRRPK